VNANHIKDFLQIAVRDALERKTHADSRSRMEGDTRKPLKEKKCVLHFSNGEACLVDGGRALGRNTAKREKASASLLQRILKGLPGSLFLPQRSPDYYRNFPHHFGRDVSDVSSRLPGKRLAKVGHLMPVPCLDRPLSVTEPACGKT
jgi:hypothetical protein